MYFSSEKIKQRENQKGRKQIKLLQYLMILHIYNILSFSYIYET